MDRTVSLAALCTVALLAGPPSRGDEAADWIAESCAMIAAGEGFAAHAHAAFGEPERCTGWAEADPDFGVHGEVTAEWPQVALVREGLLPEPRGHWRYEFAAALPETAGWIANERRARQHRLDWTTDLEQGAASARFGSRLASENAFCRIDFDSRGEVIAFQVSSLH